MYLVIRCWVLSVPGSGLHEPVRDPLAGVVPLQMLGRPLGDRCMFFRIMLNVKYLFSQGSGISRRHQADVLPLLEVLLNRFAPVSDQLLALLLSVIYLVWHLS